MTRRPVPLLIALALIAGLISGSGAGAQERAETLADIRQELSFLYVEIQRLNRELSTTGRPQTALGGETVLQRLDALEGEFRRINSKIERLEFRIERIVRDGTNRIGDLEFRLVELEGGDVSQLGETTTLGGAVETAPAAIPAAPPPEDGTGELAVSEQLDFDAARAAFEAGDFARAADLFAAFVDSYPGGPLTAEASYWRGESLAALDSWSDAARSFLQSFSAAPDGALAPKSLLRLGVSLDRIGQREEACLTLNEVPARYPDSAAAAAAGQEMTSLGCDS